MSCACKPEERGVPIHPGELLPEDFLMLFGLAANVLPIASRVPVSRISAIGREGRGITAHTALRLARPFTTAPDFWMKMQMSYDRGAESSHCGPFEVRYELQMSFVTGLVSRKKRPKIEQLFAAA